MRNTGKNVPKLVFLLLDLPLLNEGKNFNGASIVRGGPRLSQETLKKIYKNLSNLSFFQPSFCSGCHLKKIQVEFYPIFSESQEHPSFQNYK